MKSTLVFIAPSWNAELEELLVVTRESFELKILTERQDIDFEDPYVEILQCFESYSPIELARLLPWLMQLRSPQFHLILPANTSGRQLAGIGALLSMVRALPNTSITHSPWPEGNWSFPIWLKAFSNLFDGVLPLSGRRTLSLPRPIVNSPVATSKDLGFYRQLWAFPTFDGVTTFRNTLLQRLLARPENILEFWNWEQLPIRHQNKFRQEFSLRWNQFRSHTPRLKLDDWTDVKFLVLVGIKHFPFSESDLIDLVTNHRISIILDSDNRRQLNGPWKDGDTCWLWYSTLNDDDGRPWNKPYATLPFSTIADLEEYRDRMSNNILRCFMKSCPSS